MAYTRSSPYLSGLDKVMKNLNKEIAKVKAATMTGLIRAQIVIRRDMEFRSPKVPVKTGNLRSSYFTVTSARKAVAGSGTKFKGEDAAKMSSDHKKMMQEEMAKLIGRKNGPVLELGFTAYYAAFVHEWTSGVRWTRSGSGAKFLEAALKRNRAEVLRIIREEAMIK